MKKRLLAVLLCVCVTVAMFGGCGSTEKSDDSAKQEEAAEETDEDGGEESSAQSTVIEVDESIQVKNATAKQVQEFMNDSDEKTVLVDARAQEAYSGWALEGAENGGHLKNAVLFSARWLDCEYTEETPRETYLERAMKDQNITADSTVIVYDYNGEQAVDVARYFIGKGIENVTAFTANELIDSGKDVESYKNYDRFLPSEIVKSISDVKTGKEKELSAEAKAVVGDKLDKVVLVDVGWGNAKSSSYFSAGHVPGAVHINTDSYERPRVYIPEKRSDYAKEWRLVPLEEFRDEVCTQYGITKDSIVIGTGTSTSPQGRIGFMLRSLGVKYYAMSGALTAWTYNGYELDTDESTLVVPESVKEFGTDKIANPDEILWTDDIKDILSGKTEGQVADNRNEEEWNGEYSGYSYHDLAGRIEGSIWCVQGTDEDGEFFNNVDATARTQEELQGYLEEHDLDVSKTIAFFCGDSWGAAKIAYWCQSVDLNNVKEWGNGWIPWSNEGNEFIDHNGNTVHYDKYLDTVVDKDGKDVRDGVNILDDAAPEE